MRPAPLLAPIRGEAFFVDAHDRARLRCALCPADGRARGSVVLSPGRAEPLEKYAEVIAELQARCLNVLVHDWRGQGLSQRFAHVAPSVGHARGWRLFLRDLATLTETFAPSLPRPRIALSHSMGGGLSLLAMADKVVAFDAAVLCAPMLRVRLGGRPLWLVHAVAAFMGFIGQGGRPTPPATPGLDPRGGGEGAPAGQVLTHDRARWAAYVNLLAAYPELAIGRQSWSWVYFALALGRRLEVACDLSKLVQPITLVGAEHDYLVARAPQKAAAQRLPAGRYVEVAGAFHEVLMETDARRAVFWTAFDETLAALHRPTPALQA